MPRVKTDLPLVPGPLNPHQIAHPVTPLGDIQLCLSCMNCDKPHDVSRARVSPDKAVAVPTAAINDLPTGGMTIGPTAEYGYLATQNVQLTSPREAVITGLVFNLFGNAMRDAMDPRQRNR